MSEVEEINLESNIKKPRHQKQQNQSRNIRKPKNNFNRQKNNSQNRNRDRQRKNDWKQQNGANTRELYEIDIYNFLAKNQISDLISDIRSRCGNLVKLHVIANNIQENEAETKVVLKAFFKDSKSADECYFQYNDAKLDDLSLRTERKY
ncbi:unnamed protein product (macronuclear) [Paramecium tetraurelia]|uniref:RRM domain-containing protein n=1 Tax=Paramecium tetraurelia TaxID=5888 RepID=A0DG70_PARTE|nr:uncharacterized protein GSPATT00002165001 [Paramecium tetraurelia]CAK82037.1 unnamed protein product [Paramecium tetraurelia]|eukprot:XP_001449434.1 hypothetical protein (macronuclear) [Paramecium tetraurelia strain d4-2]